MTEDKKRKIYEDWKNGNGDDRKAYQNMTKLEMLEFIEYCAVFEGRPLIINRMFIALLGSYAR